MNHTANDKRAMRQAAGERLRRARISAGFPGPSAAAMKFGWNLNTYKKHETGWNNFDPHDARKYAQAFGVDAAWLLLGDATPTLSDEDRVKHAAAIKEIHEIFRRAMEDIAARRRSDDDEAKL